MGERASGAHLNGASLIDSSFRERGRCGSDRRGDSGGKRVDADVRIVRSRTSKRRWTDRRVPN